jgi:hypothetical protein
VHAPWLAAGGGVGRFAIEAYEKRLPSASGIAAPSLLLAAPSADDAPPACSRVPGGSALKDLVKRAIIGWPMSGTRGRGVALLSLCPMLSDLRFLELATELAMLEELASLSARLGGRFGTGGGSIAAALSGESESLGRFRIARGDVVGVSAATSRCGGAGTCAWEEARTVDSDVGSHWQVGCVRWWAPRTAAALTRS